MTRATGKTLPVVIEQRRLPAPGRAPQALGWRDGVLWIGSRDLQRLYAIDPVGWTVRHDEATPGIPWAAVSAGDFLWFTLGEGTGDDRYLRQYIPSQGFKEAPRIPCPEFTGSYLSYDGEHLYLSQWYKHRILKLDRSGEILSSIDVEQEICGHVFVDGVIYLLRGTEQGEEEWSLARIDPRDDRPLVEDVAAVPFPCRSLAFDGAHFWTNHRAADQVVSFTVPA